MHALKFCCLLLGARKVPKSRSSLAAHWPVLSCACCGISFLFVYSNEPRNVKRALKLPQIIWGTHSRTVFRAFEWDIAQFHSLRQRLLFGYLTLFLFSFTCRHQFYLLCPFITHTRTFSNLNYLPDSHSPFSLAIYCSINLNVNSDFHFHSECEWGLCKCFSLLKPQLAAVSTLSVGSHFGFSVGKHKHQAYAAWSATRHVRVFI